MKTIVVPIDFSPVSVNAAYYALDFALAIKGNLALVHVYQYPVTFSEVPVSAEIITQLKKDAVKKIQDLKENLVYRVEGAVNIYAEVKEGIVIKKIEDYCSFIQPYAVIMGATGKSNMERVFFGSNVLSAIQHLSWPLMIVPPDAKFTTISNVGLACDLRDVTESVHVDMIKSIVKAFRARLHLLHVNTELGITLGTSEREEFDRLREMLNEIKPVFHFISGVNIEEEVNQFSVKQKLDLLVVVPKKHSLLDRMIHKSTSSQMALHAQVPVMSIHE